MCTVALHIELRGMTESKRNLAPDADVYENSPSTPCSTKKKQEKENKGNI